jgi:hypothetical protein
LQVTGRSANQTGARFNIVAVLVQLTVPGVLEGVVDLLKRSKSAVSDIADSV